MTKRPALPPTLGDVFSAPFALRTGVTSSRLRANDLDAPFISVRRVVGAEREGTNDDNPYLAQAAHRRNRARDYAPRLTPGQFLSHETAAAWYGGPLPLVVNDEGIVDLHDAVIHVGVYGARPLPRHRGVRGHRDRNMLTNVRVVDGVPVSSPASTWASLGRLALPDLVALGDYFCRVWREGVGRPDAGRRPLATINELRREAEAGRRVGVVRLREALDLIREDSWSPRESILRVVLWQWGLPEPQLNRDVFDDAGRFLGCVDLCYPEQRIAIEYQGRHHEAQSVEDAERIARLRAAGWIVIEVTSELLDDQDRLIQEVREALAARKSHR